MIDPKPLVLLEEILEHGHGGGNWRRLIYLAIEKVKNWQVPCCGHGCCCTYKDL